MRLGAAFLLLGALLLACQPVPKSACPAKEVVLLIDTSAHELFLCKNGVPSRAFSVALGRGGTGKTRIGDDKTPLGVYALGAPRASSRFGVFIPVGYPTQEQAVQGFTGADVGVHGPDRHYAWLGGASLWVDWTSGCVAVGSDEAIQTIAAWVKSTGVSRVQLK
jgi:murein L,D-transpeptidase YafK